MTTKTIPLSQAGNADMRAFAKNVCGLNLGFGGIGNDALRAKIAECGYDSITVQEAPPSPVAPAAGTPPRRPKLEPGNVAAAPQKKTAQSKRMILVARSDDQGGDQPVPVSVNGKAMLIPRGEPVPVPASYVEVLRHAVAYHYDQIDLGGGQSEFRRREVPMYPFQDLGPAQEAAA